MNLRKSVLRAHRWLSLALLPFWIVQAITGMLLVFHWELDDASVAGPHRPTDLQAIERRLAELTSPGLGLRVSSLWTSAGAPDRYDANLESVGAKEGSTVRIDGAGGVLRVRPDSERFAQGGFYSTLASIHQNLLLSEAGSWIVGLSGLLLLSNVLLGVKLAWARWGGWRKALRVPATGGQPARLYGWHRAVGLWAALPAAALVTVGSLLVFEDGVSRWIGAAAIEAPEVRGPPRIGMAEAAGIALRLYPGSTLSAVASFPDEENAAYRIRVRQPDEWRRAFGTTNVFFSAVNGQILGGSDALRGPFTRRFIDGLFAFHTGEALGIIGRLAVLALGAWLASMVVIGVALWRARRNSPARRIPA